MSSPLLNPLDLPHITELVAESFTFEDLLSCICVSRSWHDAFIPLLWTDVITFRMGNLETTPEYLQALTKNAHYIRAITCHPKTLPTLLECRLDNLIEMNFVVDLNDYPRTPFAPGKSTQGLDDLSSLISRCCPRLRAVSIENFSLEYDSEERDLRSFVDFLDGYPAVTCLYISSVPNIPHPKQLALGDIFEHRMARVQSGKITSLIGRHSKELTRSKRGLPVVPGSGQPCGWPGREGPRKEYWTQCNVPRILPDVSHGRWEHEAWMFSKSSQTIAVLENDSALEICRPTNQYGRAQVLLDHFPALTQLRGGNYVGISDKRLKGLTATLPHLRKLEWVDYPGCVGEFHRFLDQETIEISCLDLRELDGDAYWVILQPLLTDHDQRAHFWRQALVGITIEGSDALPLAYLLEILTLCPNMQTLNVQHVSFNGTEQGVDQPWICSHLRRLDVYLNQGNQDVEVPSDANRIARRFMAQLGTMSYLRELGFHVNNRWRCSVSPFLDLTVGVINGLEQLSGLSQLEKLTISGLVHCVGPQEMKWMAKHWPKLSVIEIPVHGPIDEVSGQAQLVYAQSEGVASLDFSSWLPHLKTIVPRECFLCACCEVRPCSRTRL